jgi:uncharacterized repeat protein (TIGR03803 family)
VLNLSGNTLYGTTATGGARGFGTVFAVATNGSGFTSLHSFDAVNGACPVAEVLVSSNTLYGTTAANAGAPGYGTVFSLSLAVSPPQPPQLTITPSGPNVLLTWPASGNFFLQSASNLVSEPVWTKVFTAPIVLNGQNTVTNPISAGPQFFRLSQ